MLVNNIMKYNPANQNLNSLFKNWIIRIKAWLSAHPPKLNTILLLCTIGLLIFQQYEIEKLNTDIHHLSYDIDDIDDIESKLEDIESKLDDIESELADDIEQVRKTIILWSN